MSEDIKNNAITAANYIYQNTHGLKILCAWLDAPTRYSRIKSECDDESEAPKGLNGTVIERSDGLVDLNRSSSPPTQTFIYFPGTGY
jgi:hypothetical protein